MILTDAALLEQALTGAEMRLQHFTGAGREVSTASLCR